MKAKILFVFISVALAYLNCFGQLPKMHANPMLITASGVSSGAMMATQLLVSSSDVFQGAGSIAGAPYGCAQGSADIAKSVCMKNPDQIQIPALIDIAKKLESAGKIAPLSNLRQRTYFVFNGKLDKVVNPVAGSKLMEWTKQLMSDSYVASEFSIPAGHGFPTVSNGNPCAQESLPWINRCNYNAAGIMLSALYHQSLRFAQANPASLKKFSQAPYVANNSSMNLDGYVYIPESCHQPNIRCGVHVALHGCVQNPRIAQDNFTWKAGYNDWAEGNGMIVLYPSVAEGAGNPMGCWDWWGYSGPDYLTKTAPQIQSILAMVNQLVQSENVRAK